MAGQERRADKPVTTLSLDRIDDTDYERFLMHVSPSDCLLWTGARNGGGYGVTSYRGKLVLAHRLAWVRQYGAVPDGCVLDHVCRVRSCVNVAHLQPVSSAENTRRGVAAAKADADAAADRTRLYSWLRNVGAHYEGRERSDELAKLFPEVDPEERERIASLTFAEAQDEARSWEVVLDAAA